MTEHQLLLDLKCKDALINRMRNEISDLKRTMFTPHNARMATEYVSSFNETRQTENFNGGQNQMYESNPQFHPPPPAKSTERRLLEEVKDR